jgi:TRAP-type C4-dicarboxylate transport system substrate-binding protein
MATNQPPTSRRQQRLARAAVLTVTFVSATASLAACDDADPGADAVSATVGGATVPPVTPSTEPTTATPAPTTATGASIGAVIPFGTYERTITRAEAETSGADGAFISQEIGDEGLAIAYEFTDAGDWTLWADFCRCGSPDRGDFGTYTYDDEGRLVTTSENTDSNGFVGVIDWRIADGVLTLTPVEGRSPDGDTFPFDAISNLMTAGEYTVQEEPAAATTLRFGVTPGWDIDQLIGVLRGASEADLFAEIDTVWLDANDGADVETAIIAAVARGELDAGLVGTRAFSASGIAGFDALTAPFLVDSYDLQQAILDTDLPDQLLGALDDVGVRGLALAAGAMRYPLGVEQPFVRPSDFAGVTFHTYRAGPNTTTAEALGAIHTDVYGTDRDAEIEAGRIDVTENTLRWMLNNGQTSFVSIGTPLWPATGVLIVNPTRLDSLSEPQRTVLEEAILTMLPSAADLAAEDAELLVELCESGRRVATATDADRAELEEAVAPVHERLRQDATTAGLIDRIAALKEGITAAAPVIPPGCDG